MKRLTMLLMAGCLMLAMTASPVMRAVAQQYAVTDKNVAEKIKEAKTPAEHEQIAEYYDREAAANQSRAELHRTMKNMYFKTANRLHCNGLIRDYQQAADQDKALAAYHRGMAKEAASKAGH